MVCRKNECNRVTHMPNFAVWIRHVHKGTTWCKTWRRPLRKDENRAWLRGEIKSNIAVKLKDDPYRKMKIELDYERRSEAIQNESLTTGAIKIATLDLTGETNDIGTEVLTLCDKKKGFMGLSITDLPGLIRLPTGDQPHDTYARVKCKFCCFFILLVFLICPYNIDWSFFSFFLKN